MLGNPKSRALLLSLLFHLALTVLVFVVARGGGDSRWSGGNDSTTYKVAYVDLGHIDVPSGNTPQRDTNAKNTTQINTSKSQAPQVRLKPPPKNSGTARQTPPSRSGTGDSDTPAGGSGPGLDSDGVIEKNAPDTLAAIRKQITRHKIYPLLAKENNWTGSVKVSFKIRVDGSLEFVRILEGSRYKTLDEAALATVKKAVPLPFYPQEIALQLEYRIE